MRYGTTGIKINQGVHLESSDAERILIIEPNPQSDDISYTQLLIYDVWKSPIL